MREQSSKKYKKQEPYVCHKCNRVWQHYDHYEFIDYIIDFPKYGCSKKVCKPCKNKHLYS